MSENSTARLYPPALLFVACLAAQLYLVFFKSFNWDEFIHFSQVIQIKEGQWIQPLQVFHLRLLIWAPDVAANLLHQMLAARLFMWAMNLVTLLMIYGIARKFTDVTNSFFAAFAYMTAGYAFTQSFSIRADPVVTATLMSALLLLAHGKLTAPRAIAAGALVGLAGMMTVKAMFYAPCFAGLMWLKFRETPERSDVVGKLALIVISAFVSFAAIYLFHTWDATKAAEPLRNKAAAAVFVRWLTLQFQFAHYIGWQIFLAPMFFLCLVLAPRGWTRSGLKTDAKLALAGFIAPLAVLLFYRNTFPYFFVFLLAPVAVALGPALGIVRDRYGNIFLSVLLSAPALALAIMEPRDVIDRQRALIDYVHREFPEKVGYLDYSGMIADYPRILKYLTSGNGIRLYHEQGDAIIARESDRGNLPFIIANQEVITAALQGRPFPQTFMPADLAIMKDDYVQQWGVLWREGTHVPAGVGAFDFHLRRGGSFVLAGEDLTIDGKVVANGATMTLDKGRHLVSGERGAPATLWRGLKLPAPPPNIAVDTVFTRY
jgi:4-amino-4-deoxy-L-arabinose transferase-like glycosyltransferase